MGTRWAADRRRQRFGASGRYRGSMTPVSGARPGPRLIYGESASPARAHLENEIEHRRREREEEGFWDEVGNTVECKESIKVISGRCNVCLT